nr:hypothetical protein [Tanacetum cinerariifolium]
NRRRHPGRNPAAAGAGGPAHRGGAPRRGRRAQAESASHSAARGGALRYRNHPGAAQ